MLKRTHAKVIRELQEQHIKEIEIHHSIIGKLEDLVDTLRKQLDQTWEKAIARDLPELATYKTEDDVILPGTEYIPGLDEDNAGEILDEIEHKTSS